MSTRPLSVFEQPGLAVGEDRMYAHHALDPVALGPVINRYLADVFEKRLPSEAAIGEIAAIVDRAIILQSGGLPSEV
jgi:hypothetical protein